MFSFKQGFIFSFSSWLLFTALQNHSPSFPQPPLGRLPSMQVLLPPPCKTAQCRTAQRVSGEELCPGRASHQQAGDNRGRKGDLAGVSGKDDWPYNDWFPYLNALVISIPSLQTICIPKSLSGSQNPDPGRPKHWRRGWTQSLSLLTLSSVAWGWKDSKSSCRKHLAHPFLLGDFKRAKRDELDVWMAATLDAPWGTTENREPTASTNENYHLPSTY